MKTWIVLTTTGACLAMMFVMTAATMWNGHRSLSEYSLIWETLVAGAGCIGIILFCAIVATFTAKVQEAPNPALNSVSAGFWVGLGATIVLWIPLYMAATAFVESFTDYTS